VPKTPTQVASTNDRPSDADRDREISLRALLDGLDVRDLVNPETLDTLDRDRLDANKSSSNRLITTCIVGPFAAFLTILLIVVGPKLVGKFLIIKKITGLKFLGKVLSKKISKGIIGGSLAIVTGWIVAPRDQLERKITKPLIRPLIERITGLSFRNAEAVHFTHHGSINQILESSSLLDRGEMVDFAHPLCLRLVIDSTAFIVARVEFKRFSSRNSARISRTRTFSGVAVIAVPANDPKPDGPAPREARDMQTWVRSRKMEPTGLYSTGRIHSHHLQ
jgi:hypothetical protein